jgi:hypothetical protein
MFGQVWIVRGASQHSRVVPQILHRPYSWCSVSSVLPLSSIKDKSLYSFVAPAYETLKAEARSRPLPWHLHVYVVVP